MMHKSSREHIAKNENKSIRETRRGGRDVEGNSSTCKFLVVGSGETKRSVVVCWRDDTSPKTGAEFSMAAKVIKFMATTRQNWPRWKLFMKECSDRVWGVALRLKAQQIFHHPLTWITYAQHTRKVCTKYFKHDHLSGIDEIPQAIMKGPSGLDYFDWMI